MLAISITRITIATRTTATRIGGPLATGSACTKQYQNS
jgi:hypothetical protein